MIVDQHVSYTESIGSSQIPALHAYSMRYFFPDQTRNMGLAEGFAFGFQRTAYRPMYQWNADGNAVSKVDKNLNMWARAILRIYWWRVCFFYTRKNVRKSELRSVRRMLKSVYVYRLMQKKRFYWMPRVLFVIPNLFDLNLKMLTTASRSAMRG